MPVGTVLRSYAGEVGQPIDTSGGVGGTLTGREEDRRPHTRQAARGCHAGRWVTSSILSRSSTANGYGAGARWWAMLTDPLSPNRSVTLETSPR